jgi:ABC-type multidrug transport system ATPase subunit
MGSSGCGKTTLINCIVGLSKLDAGEIKVFEKSSVTLQKSRVGYMPQETCLEPNFNVKETLWFFGTIYGLKTKQIKANFQFLSELLELPHAEMLIKNCSGGEQRRVSFAVSLIHDPELIILDEPTVGLDPLLRERIWYHLKELTTVNNVTVFLSTHYIEEAKQSHQIGLMRNGVLLVEDSPQGIMKTLGTTDLEKAFLLLSQRQKISEIAVTHQKIFASANTHTQKYDTQSRNNNKF